MNPIPYLIKLAANNNRLWFNENREEFDRLREQWYTDIDRVLAAMAPFEPYCARLNGKDSTFRIYRDTRFSNDKTPYKTYFSAAFTPRGRNVCMAGYYLSVSPDPMDCGIYGGLWGPDSKMLSKMRHAIEDNFEEFTDIITEPELARLYPQWWGQRLKTAPKGWPKDHFAIEHLRLLHYGRFLQLPAELFNDPTWPEQTAQLMRPLKPLNDFINYTLFEEE